MSEKEKSTLFSSEEQKSVEDIAEFLIQTGQKLKEQGFFTLSQDDQQVEIRPEGATTLELKYKVKKESKHKFEIEIEWKEGAAGRSCGKVRNS